MTNTKHLEIHKNKEQTAEAVTISAGGSQVLGIENLDEQASKVTFGYTISSVLGSAEARLQECIGQDVSGNDVWTTESTSTNAQDSFTVDYPIDKVRIKIVETGGTSGLEDINVFKYTRSI
jgi:hypothetical protein